MNQQELTKKLLNKFPNFFNSHLLDNEELEFPYAVFTSLAKYFVNQVSKLEDSEIQSEVIAIVKFLDEMSESDKKIQDLLVVGFFEEIKNIEDLNLQNKVKNILDSRLNKKAKSLFNEVVTWKPPVALNRFLLEEDEK